MRRMDLKEQKKIVESVCQTVVIVVVFIGVAILITTGSLFITGRTDMEPFDMMRATGMICILGGVMVYLMISDLSNAGEVAELKRRVKMLEDEIHGMDEEAEEES